MWSRGQSLLPPCNCEYGYLAVHTSRCSQRHAELMEAPGPTIVEVPEEPSASPRCGKCNCLLRGFTEVARGTCIACHNEAEAKATEEPQATEEPSERTAYTRH